MTRFPCIPPELPTENLDWKRLVPLVGQANAALARYDGMLQALLNPAVLLSPITANEAVLSSRIEGTVATLEEVLQKDAGIEQTSARNEDIEEIANYRSALNQAEQDLSERSVSLSLIKGLHQRLLRGVRGHDKSPGEFRVDQNWIGKQGCSMEQARFIPPNPMILPQALEDWERYLGETGEDPVLHIGFAHAQFEILHPFKDGNGRIGRMLVPLLLFQRNALSRPMFYLSEYLEEHRSEYYDQLLKITEESNWQGWIEFFLEAVRSQAETNLDKVKLILSLYESQKVKFIEATHSQFAVPSLDAFFMKPIINATDFAKIAGIENRVTANGILMGLYKAQLVSRIRVGSGRSPAVFALPELINITEGRPIMRATRSRQK